MPLDSLSVGVCVHVRACACACLRVNVSSVNTVENSKYVPVILSSHPPKDNSKALTVSITEHSSGGAAPSPLSLLLGFREEESQWAGSCEVGHRGGESGCYSQDAEQLRQPVEEGDAGSRRWEGEEWLCCCFYTIKEDHCNWEPMNHNTSACGSFQL